MCNQSLIDFDKLAFVDYLTVKEVSELKKCSGSYISRMIRDKKIDYIEKINISNNQPYYLIPVSALSELSKSIQNLIIARSVSENS